MLRLGLVLAAFVSATPVYIAALWLIDRLRLPGRRPLTVGYCRLLCALLRVRIRTVGRPLIGRPALVLCNHVSWLDIPVLASTGLHTFVAKREVASWPIVGLTARLQRTVFVDRTRRAQTAQVNAAIARRLSAGDPVVLFAEGTSSDGNRVLGFRSALLGALCQAGLPDGVPLQPTSIGYTHVHGVPMGRRHRPLVAWYGDLEFMPHFIALVRNGPYDVTVTFGEPIAFDSYADRKAVARSLEAAVRRLTASTLRAREPAPIQAA